jgi:predicted Zn-dependent protease
LWSFSAAAWQAGQMEAAEQLYGQLVERVPNVMSFRVRLAEAQSRQGKTAAAIATLEAAAALTPNDPSVREALGAQRAPNRTTQPAAGATP